MSQRRILSPTYFLPQSLWLENYFTLLACSLMAFAETDRSFRRELYHTTAVLPKSRIPDPSFIKMKILPTYMPASFGEAMEKIAIFKSLRNDKVPKEADEALALLETWRDTVTVENIKVSY